MISIDQFLDENKKDVIDFVEKTVTSTLRGVASAGIP